MESRKRIKNFFNTSQCLLVTCAIKTIKVCTLLLLLCYLTESRENRYNLYRLVGSEIEGTLGRTFTDISVIHCSVKCSSDISCLAYKYHLVSAIEECQLIYNNSLQGSVYATGVYRKESLQKHPNVDQLAGSAVQPSGTSDGDDEPAAGTAVQSGSTSDSDDTPAYHNNFSSTDGLQLMNGATHFLTPSGTYAVKTDRSMSQWVDLGVISEACFPRLHTCSPGGTIAAWIRIVFCEPTDGIISSHIAGRSGFALMCDPSAKIRYKIRHENGSFQFNANKPSEWFHSVVVYHGSAVCQGITVYHNGMIVGSQPSKDSSVNFQPGEGRIIIGKLEAIKNNNYASVEVDELLMWNRTLTEQEIQELSTNGT